MSFAAPVFLAVLLVPAVAVAGYLWLERRPARYAVAFPNLEVLESVRGRDRGRRRHLLALLAALALVVLGVAVARPHATMLVPSERATVVLALDVSGSMRAEDVEPSRIEAARDAISRFLDRTPKEIRVGLVLFSSDPYTAVVPTHDHDVVREALEIALPQSGTAIGDAVARAAELAKSTVAEGAEPAGQIAGVTLISNTTGPREDLATVVFLSDGFQTRGLLTPEEGAEQARRAGIRVHTIALGTDSGTIVVERYGERRVIPVAPDRPTLAAVAETTGGTAYDVRDVDRLVDVYEELGSSVGRVEEAREATAAFVAVGAILLAAAGLLAALWSPRLP